MTAFGPDLPRVTELAPGVTRLLAPNPSMMTGPGTNTYLFGSSEIAVIDPGPNLPDHIDRIIEYAGAPIRWILVTHTHPDHSPAAVPLARLTGAEILGMPSPGGEHQDTSFEPDRVLADGDYLTTDEFEIEAVHTPGHASNHLCYLHAELNWLLTGDLVIDGSTVVINPPDGDMKTYIDSLRRVKVMGCESLLPGHGGRIDDPVRVINWIIGHRMEREAKVLAALTANPGATLSELIPSVYRDVAGHLFQLAERSLLAHLLKLESEGIAENNDGRWGLHRLPGR
jgi:glyoxylase-like metal-dependent hydrolase (beta-lactamase superfamily II)